MNRKRMVYLTDLILIPLFILTLYTGIELHVAGHGTNHAAWHDWAVFHTIAGLLFTLLGVAHVRTHRAWYKGMNSKSIKGKSKIVLVISFVSIPVIVTSVMLLFCVKGSNSSIGLLHYKAGLIMGLLGILHLLTRFRFIRDGFPSILPNRKRSSGCYNSSKP